MSRSTIEKLAGALGTPNRIGALVILGLALLMGADKSRGWPLTMSVCVCVWTNIYALAGLFVMPTLPPDGIFYAVFVFVAVTFAAHVWLTQNEGAIASWYQRILSNRPELAGIVKHVIVPLLTGSAASWTITLVSPSVFEIFLVERPVARGVRPGAEWPVLGAGVHSVLSTMFFATSACAVLGLKLKVYQPPASREVAILLFNVFAVGTYYVYAGLHANAVRFPAAIVLLAMHSLPVIIVGGVSVYAVQYGSVLLAHYNWLKGRPALLLQLIGHYVLSCTITLWSARAGERIGERIFESVASTRVPVLHIHQSPSILIGRLPDAATVLVFAALASGIAWLATSAVSLGVWFVQKAPVFNIRPQVLNTTLVSIDTKHAEGAEHRAALLSSVRDVSSKFHQVFKDPKGYFNDLWSDLATMSKNLSLTQVLKGAIKAAAGQASVAKLFDEAKLKSEEMTYHTRVIINVPIERAHTEPVTVERMALVVQALFEPDKVKQRAGWFGKLLMYRDIIEGRATEVDVVVVETDPVTIQPSDTGKSVQLACTIYVGGTVYLPIARAINLIAKDISDRLAQPNATLEIPRYIASVIASAGSSSGILADHVRSLLRGYRMFVRMNRKVAMPPGLADAPGDSTLAQYSKAFSRACVRSLGPLQLPILHFENGEFRHEVGSVFSGPQGQAFLDSSKVDSIIKGLSAASMDNFDRQLRKWQAEGLCGILDTSKTQAAVNKLLVQMEEFRVDLAALHDSLQKSGGSLTAGSAPRPVAMDEPLHLEPTLGGSRPRAAGAAASVPAPTPVVRKSFNERVEELVATKRPRELLLNALLALLDVKIAGDELFEIGAANETAVIVDVGMQAAPGAQVVLQSAGAAASGAARGSVRVMATPLMLTTTSTPRTAEASPSMLQALHEAQARALVRAEGEARVQTNAVSEDAAIQLTMARIQQDFKKAWRDCAVALLGTSLRAGIRAAVERATRSNVLDFVDQLRHGVVKIVREPEKFVGLGASGNVQAQASAFQATMGMLQDMSALETIVLLAACMQCTLQVYTMWGSIQPELPTQEEDTKLPELGLNGVEQEAASSSAVRVAAEPASSGITAPTSTAGSDSSPAAPGAQGPGPQRPASGSAVVSPTGAQTSTPPRELPRDYNPFEWPGFAEPAGGPVKLFNPFDTLEIPGDTPAPPAVPPGLQHVFSDLASPEPAGAADVAVQQSADAAPGAAPPSHAPSASIAAAVERLSHTEPQPADPFPMFVNAEGDQQFDERALSQPAQHRLERLRAAAKALRFTGASSPSNDRDEAAVQAQFVRQFPDLCKVDDVAVERRFAELQMAAPPARLPSLPDDATTERIAAATERAQRQRDQMLKNRAEQEVRAPLAARILSILRERIASRSEACWRPLLEEASRDAPTAPPAQADELHRRAQEREERVQARPEVLEAQAPGAGDGAAGDADVSLQLQLPWNEHRAWAESTRAPAVADMQRLNRSKLMQHLTESHPHIMRAANSLVAAVELAGGTRKEAIMNVVPPSVCESLIADADGMRLTIPAVAMGDDRLSEHAGNAAVILRLLSDAHDARCALDPLLPLPPLERLIDVKPTEHDQHGVPTRWDFRTQYVGSPYTEHDRSLLHSAMEAAFALSALDRILSVLRTAAQRITQPFHRVMRPMILPTQATPQNNVDDVVACTPEWRPGDTKEERACSRAMPYIDQHVFRRASNDDALVLTSILGLDAGPDASATVDSVLSAAMRVALAGSKSRPRFVLPLHHVAALLYEERLALWRLVARVATVPLYCTGYQYVQSIAQADDGARKSSLTPALLRQRFNATIDYGKRAIPFAADALATPRPLTGVGPLDADAGTAAAADAVRSAHVAMPRVWTCAVKCAFEKLKGRSMLIDAGQAPNLKPLIEFDTYARTEPVTVASYAMHWRTEEEQSVWRNRLKVAHSTAAKLPGVVEQMMVRLQAAAPPAPGSAAPGASPTAPAPVLHSPQRGGGPGFGGALADAAAARDARRAAAAVGQGDASSRASAPQAEVPPMTHAAESDPTSVAPDAS